LITLRSSASSNAWRRSEERAIAVPTFSYAFVTPFLFPMFNVIPWYPIEVDLSTRSDLSAAIARSSVEGMTFSTSISCERRFCDRADGSTMILNTIESRWTFLRP
jgi:hypothetical protein